MVVGYDISAYTAMKCFSGAAVTRKTAEVVSKILGVSVRDAFRFERDERPLSKKTIREYVLFANQVLHFANERYHSVQAEFKKPEKGTRPRFVDCIHEDDVKKLMAEISKYPIQEQAIVLSLLNTGVRRAELAGLTWCDFDSRNVPFMSTRAFWFLGASAISTQPSKKATTVLLMQPRSTWHLCSNTKNAGSRYAIS